MAEAKARLLSLEDVRASVKRMQVEGERLVGQIRRDARRFVERDGRRAVDRVLALADVRKLRADVRKRAESAVQDFEATRSRVMQQVQQRIARVTNSIVKTIGAASHGELEDLKRRLSQIERRVESLAKEKSNKDQAA